MLAEARLDALADRLVVRDWAPDADGRRTLRFDGDLVVAFETPDAKTVRMQVRLGKLPDEPWAAERLLESLLKANLARRAAGKFAPAVLSLEEKTRMAFIFCTVLADSTDDGGFVEAVDWFVSDAEFWRERWREFRPAERASLAGLHFSSP